nr:PH domain-containing protein [Streptomyces boncukensis]
MAGGVALLALAVWLVSDAAINGHGDQRALALSGLLCGAPLVVAFTLRPAVYAGEQRLRIRNPFRTVTAPWGSVESVRAGYSCEVVADGAKYQMWAIPVSLRDRKKAHRHNERIASGQGAAPRGGLFGGRGVPDVDPGEAEEKRAHSDQAVDELRELLERHGESEPAQGRVSVRWAYEVLAPAAAGAIALIVLYATR